MILKIKGSVSIHKGMILVLFFFSIPLKEKSTPNTFTVSYIGFLWCWNGTFCATHGWDPCKRLAQLHSSSITMGRSLLTLNVSLPWCVFLLKCHWHIVIWTVTCYVYIFYYFFLLNVRWCSMILVTFFITGNPLKKSKSIVNVGWKLGAKCYGVTMSHVQVEKAQVLAAAQGLPNRLLRLIHRL